MLYSVHKYMISITAMQLISLEYFMIYTDTNYTTQCIYLCNIVGRIKISFLLHVHKFRMTRMCVERKLIHMHVNKKSYLNALFLP
jgi:hypothetical protein